MDCVVQWATILSPIIAVVIAWWTIRKSAKDTDKKIAAIEESTKKQVESIKKLTKIQIEISQIQIQKELWEAKMRNQQSLEKMQDMRDYNRFFNQIGDGPDHFRRQHEQEYDLKSERDFQANYYNKLGQYLNRITELSKEIGVE
jgi:hypothetical protein